MTVGQMLQVRPATSDSPSRDPCASVGVLFSRGRGRLFGGPGPVRAQTERAAKAWTDADLTGVTLHEARHTYASLMIAAGVNAKALSTFMGHANIAVTIDLYGHLMPGSEAEAAELLDAYIAREAGGTSPATSPDPTETAA